MRVLGFEFESEEQYAQAKKELQAINYVKEQTKMNDPDVVMKVYTALVDQNAFETPVGYTFLEELQEYLKTVPYIKAEDIKPIKVKKVEALKEKATKPHKVKAVKAPKQKKEKAIKEQTKVVSKEPPKYKVLFRVCLFFSIVFLLIIGGMFTITYLSGNNTNIINYEDQLINKYEEWEQELKERESQLIEREQELLKGSDDGKN